MIKTIPEPDLIGRNDVHIAGRWKIRETQPVRGLPRTCIEEREMHVPFGLEERDRCIRAHEMIHAKVSPTHEDFRGWVSRGFASEKALIIAEESRVNFLATILGYPMETELIDGREILDAIDLTKMGDWANLVASAISGVFTAGEKKWIEGAASVDKNCGEQIANIIKYVRAYWTALGPGTWATDEYKSRAIEALCEICGVSEEQQEINEEVLKRATECVDEQGPVYVSPNNGFAYSEELAVYIDRWLNAGDMIAQCNSETDLAASLANESDESGHNGLNKKPVWDTLRFWPGKPMQPVHGAVSRKRIATNTGKYPRRVERLLTDPDRRIFDTVKKAEGGVVLIDGSGSMDFDSDDIEKMVLAAPGCTVAVYSAPDDPTYYGTTKAAEYTMFILAESGRMLSRDLICTVRDTINGGNGCDLPALKWAINRRKNNKQPIVWVTDGQIHGSSMEVVRAARIAQSAGVMYAHNTTQAVELLRKLRRVRRVKTDMPGIMSYMISELFNCVDLETVLDPKPV